MYARPLCLQVSSKYRELSQAEYVEWKGGGPGHVQT